LKLVHSGAPFIRSGQCSSNLEIKGDGAFVTLSSLKLHRVALIKILDLNTRSEAAAMKEYILAAVVWRDESKSLLPDDFFNRSGHDSLSSVLFAGVDYLKGPESARLLDNPALAP
jgi:hypothetical protein